MRPVRTSVQDDAIAGQEHPLASAAGLDHQIPLAWSHASRDSAIISASVLRNVDSLVDAPVGRTLQQARDGKPGERGSICVVHTKRQGGGAIGPPLDMRIDFPVAGVLFAG